ncbi:hypothetical protein [Actinoplanes sp. NPDC051494]|uniref:hypothetical protein n=1 Tax=Actinoplanes sp. NPDC051494 TaxID=3363907 RepID=UPI00379E506A
MLITRPMVAGAVVALAGHGLAVVATIAVAVAAAGGTDVDLDAGGRFAAVVFMACTYGVAQMILLVVCVASWSRLGSGSLPGILTGWVLGMAATMFYLCGGFGT